jgi:glycosyltransferase involved in cell wall biosynthesis
VHVAVITPAYNVAPYIGDAIRSVLGQTHTDWSMVVIDDGSSDATSDIVSTFCDDRISLIQQPNAGVSAARNSGIAARAMKPKDAVLFLDGDDWLAPCALADLMTALDMHPTAIAAVGRYVRVRIDGTGKLAHTPPHGYLLPALLNRNLFANGGHLLIRSEIIDQAGPFRQDLHYGEDWEYWTRVALFGPFAALRRRPATLFVRERPGSACHGAGCDPALHACARDAIYSNPEIIDVIGQKRLSGLRRSVDAETAWTIGREFVRHGELAVGNRWLCRSLFSRPTVKRLFMMPLAWTGTGPFRQYCG